MGIGAGPTFAVGIGGGPSGAVGSGTGAGIVGAGVAPGTAAWTPASLTGLVDEWDAAATYCTSQAAGVFDVTTDVKFQNTDGTGFADPTANDGQTAITLYKFTGGNQGRAGIISWHDVSVDRVIEIYHNRTGGSVYAFQVVTDQNAASCSAQTGNYTAGTIDGTWLMVVGRVDNTNNRLRVEVYDTGGTQILDSGWTANANVDGTYDDDGSTTRLSVPRRVDSTTTPVHTIQNACIWNEVLSDAQISSLLNSGSFYTLDEALLVGSGPVHAYRMGTDNGAEVDEGSVGKDLTRVNSPTNGDGVVAQAPADRIPVKTWTGKVNSETITQATIGNQPTWVASGHNGEPTLDFASASTQYLQGTFGASATQPVYVAAVVDQHGGSSNGVWDGAANEVLYFTDTQHKISAGAFASLGGTPNRTAGQAQIYEVVYSGASSQLFIDGAQQGSDSNAGTNAMDGLTVGARKGATQPMDGEFGGILVVDGAVTSEDQANVQSYYGTKFGITV